MSNPIKRLVKDVKRYKELKEKLNPNNDSFVEMENTPEWKEFNKLTMQLKPLIINSGFDII